MKNNSLQKGVGALWIILIVIGIAAVAGIGFFVYRNVSKTESDGTIVRPDGTMVKPDGTTIAPDGTIAMPDGMIIRPDGKKMKPDGTIINPDGTMISPGSVKEPLPGGTVAAGYSGKVLAGSSAPLLEFVKADYDKALASDKLVVLYFYANWCPICRAEIPNLYGAFNELTSSDVIGFRINFNDSDTDSNEVVLARQYGITYQHTKVFLRNNQQVLKAPDSWDKARYLSEINKAL